MQSTALPFFAGVDPEGEPVFESLAVTLVDASDRQVQLVKSPLLIRNLAAGDRIRVIDPAAARYDLLQRSGNLAIRVFRRHQLDAVEEYLTPLIEKLDGALDVNSERALVYSMHYSIGFTTIEELMSRVISTFPDTVWYYGNVYDPNDGTTPLNWWLDIDSEQ